MAKRRSGLASFLRLPAATKALAVEAAVFLALARCLVVYVPLRRWRDRVATARQERSPVPALAWKVAWVVRKVAAAVPFGAACLPQAMAAQWMLRRRSVASQLKVGVRPEADVAPDATERSSALGFAYHAWLQVGDECVVGCREIDAYAAFPPFDSVRQSLAS